VRRYFLYTGGNAVALPIRSLLRAPVLPVFLLAVAVLGLAHGHGKDDWPVPAEAKKMKNPVPASEAGLAAARGPFAENCAQCHGETGKGDGPMADMTNPKPADFSDAHMMGEMTDGEIFYKIGEGRMPMPSFKKKFSGEQRWQLVNLIRTFAPKPAPKNSAPAKKPDSSHKH
jgi:mono/diheme cytochrome c family protein